MNTIRKVRITFKQTEPIMLVKLYDERTQSLTIEFKFVNTGVATECHVRPIYRSEDISKAEIESLVGEIEEYFACLIIHFKKRKLL